MKVIYFIIFVILLVAIANLLYSNNQSVVLRYFPFDSYLTTTVGIIALTFFVAGMITMYVMSLLSRLGSKIVKSVKS